MMEMEEPSSSSSYGGAPAAAADHDNHHQRQRSRSSSRGAHHEENLAGSPSSLQKGLTRLTNKIHNNTDEEESDNPSAKTASTTATADDDHHDEMMDTSDAGALSVDDILSHYDGESNTGRLLRQMRKSYAEKGRLSMRSLDVVDQEDEDSSVSEKKEETTATPLPAAAAAIAAATPSLDRSNQSDDQEVDDRKESNKLFYQLLGMTHDNDNEEEHQSTGENTTDTAKATTRVQHFGDREMKLLVSKTPELWSTLSCILESQNKCRKLATTAAAMVLASGKQDATEALKSKISRKQFHQFRMDYIVNSTIESRVYFFQCAVFAMFALDSKYEDNLDEDEMDEFLDAYYRSNDLLEDASEKDGNTDHLKLPEREPFKKWLYEHCHKNVYGEVSLKDISRFVLVKKVKPTMKRTATITKDEVDNNNNNKPKNEETILNKKQQQQQQAEGGGTGTAAAAAHARAEALLKRVEGAHTKTVETEVKAEVALERAEVSLRAAPARVKRLASSKRGNDVEAEINTEKKEAKEEDGWGGCILCEWVEKLFGL